jgi:hypothetical protein
VAGITERTVQATVADLEGAGYITRTWTGRRTRYAVNPDNLFRHPPRTATGSGRSWPCWPTPATSLPASALRSNPPG